MTEYPKPGDRVRWQARYNTDPVHEGVVVWSMQGRALEMQPAIQELVTAGLVWSRARQFVVNSILLTRGRGVLVRVDRPKGPPQYFIPLLRTLELIP